MTFIRCQICDIMDRKSNNLRDDCMVERLFTGFIFGMCALIMFGIGIFQVKSRNPVGFYSGETPPTKEQLTDVDAWNRKHGTMWIIYGFCIVITWLCSLVIGDGALLAIVCSVGLLLPVLFMVLYHHKLMKEYLKK